MKYCLLLCLALLAGLSLCGLADEQAAGKSAIMAAYRQRLELVRQNIPRITAAAEAVAKRWAEKKQVLFHYPFGGDTSDFTMENIARAGGLDNNQTNTVRMDARSANDVIVVGPRSWEKGAAFLRTELPKSRERGWMIVVFGSKAGVPEGLPFDFLIDNGAQTGGENEAALNQIVNMTNGWIYTCELTAALARLGVRPGILKGMPLPGAQVHNAIYQVKDGVPVLYPCDTPIPAGSLAKLYLAQIEREMANLEGKFQQDQLDRAAAIAARHVADGKTLWACSMTHVLDGEVFLNNLSPIKAFRGISCGEKGETFTRNLKPGDLLLFFGEWSLNLPWRDYLAIIRQTKAHYIPGWRVCTEEMEPYDGPAKFYDQDVPDAEMVLEQQWPFEGAVVPIPFAPYKMAPISGIYLCLQYRMLDEKIAAALKAQ